MTLKIGGCNKVHAKKKLKHNATSTDSIAHIVRRGSSNERCYYDSGGTKDMSIEKTVHFTLGNGEKVIIKGLRNLTNPS